MLQTWILAAEDQKFDMTQGGNAPHLDIIFSEDIIAIARVIGVILLIIEGFLLIKSAATPRPGGGGGFRQIVAESMGGWTTLIMAPVAALMLWDLQNTVWAFNVLIKLAWPMLSGISSLFSN